MGPYGPQPGQGPNPDRAHDCATNPSAVLEAALHNDASGLLEISLGMGGGSFSAQLSNSMVSRIASVSNGLPSDILRALLEEPLCLQQLWMLTSTGLPWLVHQGRCFQVILAAHHPNIFQHLFAEGIAPELFFLFMVYREEWSDAGYPVSPKKPTKT